MPVPFEGPPSELAGLTMFLEEQRAALLRKLDGLTDEQATTRSTHSAFCMLTLVKHAAFVERRWFQLEIARRDIEGLWPPPDDRELRLEPGDDVASIRAFYEGVIAENRVILAGVTDLDSVSGGTRTEGVDAEGPLPDGAGGNVSEGGLNRRWVLLHLIEELARHAGHADIIREQLDGRTGA